MKKLLRSFILLGSIGVLLMFSSCKDEDGAKNRKQSLEDYVSTLKEPFQPEIPEKNLDTTYYEKSASEICSYTEYERGASFNDNFLLDPSVDVIYPGALINGASISSGDYVPVNIRRGPITIYTSLMNKEGKVYQEVSNPNGATVNQAIKELIYDAEINGATAADLIFDVTEIITEDQLDVELGVSLKASKVNFSNKFEFSSTSKKHNYLIKYVQRMFTVSMINPITSSDLFAQDVTASDLENALHGSQIPCYVGSVSYGRAVYAIMQTEESNSKLADDLKTEINAIVKAGVDASTSKYASSSKYSFSGSILGGNADEAVKGIQGIEDIVNFIKSKGNFSKENPPAMLSYKLNKITDNSTFAVKKAAKYTVKNCETYSGGVRLAAIEARTAEHGGGDAMEPYGDVVVYVDGNNATIFTLLESQHLGISKGDKLRIQDNSIGGKKCSTGASPNLNLANVEGLMISVNFKDSDPSGDKNDPYFSSPGTKYGEEKNEYFSANNNKQMRDAIEKLQNGEHTAEFYLEVKRVYDKKEYDSSGRKDFYTDPDIVRLHFEISM